MKKFKILAILGMVFVVTSCSSKKKDDDKAKNPEEIVVPTATTVETSPTPEPTATGFTPAE